MYLPFLPSPPAIGPAEPPVSSTAAPDWPSGGGPAAAAMAAERAVRERRPPFCVCGGRARAAPPPPARPAPGAELTAPRRPSVAAAGREALSCQQPLPSKRRAWPPPASGALCFQGSAWDRNGLREEGSVPPLGRAAWLLPEGTQPVSGGAFRSP
ncbi:atherin-like [Colius striatus]|uniref:atherin-like n=1 Tax=Colius striatus TaxID=57412 RepID=UPI002B1E4E3D|nr:atherin-like [Colius striatus]